MSARAKDTLALIGASVFLAAIVGWAGWYGWFYWTNCAFVPTLDAPTLCHLGAHR